MAFTLADLIEQEKSKPKVETVSQSSAWHKLFTGALILGGLWGVVNFVRAVGDTAEKFRKPRKAYLYEARANFERE